MNDWNPPTSDLENVDQAGESGRCDYCGDPMTRVERWAGHSNQYVVTDKTCDACREWGAPCAKCGARASLKHGDPDDCRSADCLSSKIDAAMDRLEDSR